MKFETKYNNFVQQNAFTNVVCKMLTILFRLHCVKTLKPEQNGWHLTDEHNAYEQNALIARFMAPTWGPSGADRTQVGQMLAPCTLLSGWLIASMQNKMVDILQKTSIQMNKMADIPQTTSLTSMAPPRTAVNRPKAREIVSFSNTALWSSWQRCKMAILCSRVACGKYKQTNHKEIQYYRKISSIRTFVAW